MAPRLMRFYGGSLREWASAPWGVVEVFWRAMPRLRAEECLVAARVAAVGAGTMEKADHVSAQKHWLEVAGIEIPKAAKPRDPAEARARMAASGIFFEEARA